MFALRRRFVSRASIALTASASSAMRWQGSGRRGPGGPPRGGAPDERQLARQRMMQQQMQHEQHQQQRAPAPEQEAEQESPPEPPKKPENTQFVKVDESPDGAFVLRMSRAPVNSLNLEFFTEICDWFMWLSTDESGCKSIVLTSDVATVFSAGLDISELHKPEPERFQRFWFSFQEVWLIMNSFPKPIIAAINGNAPAGGCILSMCCDYRIMARASLKDPANPKPYRIGLNETKLGIVAPPWVMLSLAYTVGDRKAERMLQLGETPTADEALELGLVDRVVEENEVFEAARQEAKKFQSIAVEARWMSKDIMRRKLLQFFEHEDARAHDVEFVGQMLQNADVQDNIGKYLARLKGNKK